MLVDLENRLGDLKMLTCHQELFPNPQCDDETMKPEYPLLEWTKIMDDAAMNFGRPIRIANKLKKWYLEAGFEEVHEQVFKVPLNEWPREPHFKTMGRVRMRRVAFRARVILMGITDQRAQYVAGVARPQLGIDVSRARLDAERNRGEQVKLDEGSWITDVEQVYLINVRKALSDREVHGYYKV